MFPFLFARVGAHKAPSILVREKGEREGEALLKSFPQQGFLYVEWCHDEKYANAAASAHTNNTYT